MNQEFIRKETMMADGIRVYADFIIADSNNEVVIAGYFDRAKVKVKALACNMGRKTIVYGYSKYATKGVDYKTVYKPVRLGRDRFVYGLSISKKVGDSYIITTKEFAKADFFQFLMKKCHLPLLEEWTDYIYDACMQGQYCQKSNVPRNVRSVLGRKLPLHDVFVDIKDICILDVELISNEVLSNVVSDGLKSGAIKLGKNKMEPLEFSDFNSYIQNYGASMVNHLEEQIETLAPLKGTVEEIAFKKKRLFPQQAACINGIMALKEAGSRYGLMVEGMGCGKTIQGAGVVDAYFNKKWLREHPQKTLKNLYEEGKVAYRSIMMAPSHLVEKWKEEILSEIPGATVEILDDFSKLEKLRKKGKKRSGREWYLISKDTCKLGSHYSPIPTDVGYKYPKICYCADCMEAGKMIPKKGVGNKSRCPDCGSRKFVARTDVSYGRFRGMLCPDCGELLLSPSSKLGSSDCEMDKYVLRPLDFAARTMANNVCYHCGMQLWGVDAKPLDMGGEYSRHVQNRKPAWYKISHYKNHAKKSRKSAFVLRGHEQGYLAENEVFEYEVSAREYGPRKIAPSLFIKKYLKGYFDFCILDEAHKYENGGTAQSNAAQALISVSDFTIGLTGTISNGKADSFFYLLYMLDPRRMRQRGFSYNDVTAFAKKYGTIETVYDVSESAGTYNSASRGRMIQSPRVKPGISPLLFVDFLLDKSVFLDLSDLSKYLPPFTEEVVLVDMDEDVRTSYTNTIDVLKEAIRSPEGAGMLSNILQFGLSYPDKPWDRKDMVSLRVKDCLVARVDNYPEYEHENRLLPKEQKLIELVNKEISEGRNCFVYCSYTGDGETNVTYRLQKLIEEHCNLRGRVQILNSTSPKPVDRERWIKQKAAEGFKVFICNPKCVETGLDFCFWWEGKFYNYPTLIFYQVSYELAVMWQASRRAYRLSQVVDCRNYYIACENTLQAAALELMAEKQVAASAIQGKFSAEGLTAMARGVDPRLKLAQMLSSNDLSSRNTLSNMFDVINTTNNNAENSDVYGDVAQALTYYELMGYVEEAANVVNNEIDLFQMDYTVVEKETVNVITTEQIAVRTEVIVDEVSVSETNSLFDFVDLFAPVETIVFRAENNISARKPEKKLKNKKAVEGQPSLFDILSA